MAYFLALLYLDVMHIFSVRLVYPVVCMNADCFEIGDAEDVLLSEQQS